MPPTSPAESPRPLASLKVLEPTRLDELDAKKTPAVPTTRSKDNTPLPSEAVAKRGAEGGEKLAEAFAPLDATRKYQSVDAKTGQQGEITSVGEQIALAETKRASEPKVEMGGVGPVADNRFQGASDIGANPSTVEEKAPKKAEETVAEKAPVLGEASLDATFGKSISETGIIAKLMPKHGDQFDVAVLGGASPDVQDGVIIGGSPVLSYGEGAVSTGESLQLSVAQCITPNGAACTSNVKDAGLKSGDILYTNKTMTRTTAGGAPELIQLGFVADKDFTKADAIYHKMVWENGTLKSVGVKEAGFGPESAFNMGFGTKDGGLVLLGNAAVDNKGTKNILVYAEDSAGKKLCTISNSVITSKDGLGNPYLEEPIAIREDGPGQVIVVALREDHEKPYPYDRKLVWYRVKPAPECARDYEFGTNGAITTELPSDVTEISAAAFDNVGRLVVAARYEDQMNVMKPERSAVIRYLANGELDNNFAPPTGGINFNTVISGAVNFGSGVLLTALTIDGANNIIVGGTMETKEITDQDFISNFGKNSFSLQGHNYDLDFYVARITQTGQFDTQFAPLGKGYITINFPGSFFDTVTGLALDSKGRIVVTGSISYHKVVNKSGNFGIETALDYDTGVGVVRLETKKLASSSADGTGKPGDVAGGEGKKDDRAKVVTVKRSKTDADKRNLKSVIAEQRTLKKAARAAGGNDKKSGDIAGKTEEKEIRLLSLRGVVGHDLKKDKREKAEGREIKDEGEKKEKENYKEERVAKEVKEKCWQPAAPDARKVVALPDPACRCWQVKKSGEGHFKVELDRDCKLGKKYASDIEPALADWAVTEETVVADVAQVEVEKEKCWFPMTVDAGATIIPMVDPECRCWKITKSSGGQMVPALDPECKDGQKVTSVTTPALTAWNIIAETVTVAGEVEKEKCWKPMTIDNGMTLFPTPDPECHCWQVTVSEAGPLVLAQDAECKQGKKIVSVKAALPTAWGVPLPLAGGVASVIAETGDIVTAGPTIAQLVSSASADIATDAVSASGEIEIVAYEAPSVPLPADAIYVTPTSTTDASTVSKETKDQVAPSSGAAPAAASSGGGCSLIRN